MSDQVGNQNVGFLMTWLLYFGQMGLVVQDLGLLVVLWYQGSRGHWRACMGHMIWISDFDLSGGNLVCGCIARKSFVIWYLIIRQFMDFTVSQMFGVF